MQKEISFYTYKDRAEYLLKIFPTDVINVIDIPESETEPIYKDMKIIEIPENKIDGLFILMMFQAGITFSQKQTETIFNFLK
jgi:hypothetical protein